MAERQILGTRWFTNRNGHYGIVAAVTGTHDPSQGEWKAYLSIVVGFDTQADEQYVANWGAPLMPEEAHGFFPHLDISKYKEG